MNWLPVPIEEEPPALDLTGPSLSLVKRVERLVARPGVWYRLGVGTNVGQAARQIRLAASLPGRWESMVRNEALYARFLGVDE